MGKKKRKTPNATAAKERYGQDSLSKEIRVANQGACYTAAKRGLWTLRTLVDFGSPIGLWGLSAPESSSRVSPRVSHGGWGLLAGLFEVSGTRERPERDIPRAPTKSESLSGRLPGLRGPRDLLETEVETEGPKGPIDPL